MKNKKKKVLAILLISIFVCNFSIASDYTDTSGMDLITVSLINQDPDPAIAGDLLEIRLGVENIGGLSVNDLNIELVPEYPFGLVSGEDGLEKINTIRGNQDENEMQKIKFK